jgi:hypothetical protein
MTKYRLIPYESSHVFDLLEQGMLETFPKSVITEYFGKISEGHAQNGIGFSLFKEDMIVGCGGIDIAKDEGLAWLILSLNAINSKKTVIRTIKITLDTIINGNNLKKVYALIDEDNLKAQATARILRFTYQPSIPKLTGIDGKIYLTYRREA